MEFIIISISLVVVGLVVLMWVKRDAKHIKPH